MPYLKCSVATCVLFAAVCTTASAKIDRVVEKSFQVQPGVRLVASTSGGEIKVIESKDLAVRVVAKEHIRASDDAEADAILKNLDLRIEQVGNEVRATSTYNGQWGFHLSPWPPVEVDFLVYVPSSASVDVKTSGGDLLVGNIEGSVRAKTSGGEIKLGRIGSEIDASTSGGDVQLDEGRAATRLSTSGGTISVGRVAGPANLRTSGGDIRIDSVGDTVDAETSGGSVRAVFDGPLKGNCSLSTSGGEVKATVGSSVGLHLEARTSGGDANASGLTIRIDQGGPGKSTLTGDVNGGGPVLRLRSSGGDIDVISRKG
jgi:hypothetical protein